MNKNITSVISEKIERANKDFSLFENKKSILAGLSGGADSVCLLLSLKELSAKYGFCLYALHINHLIREGEADRDEKFSKALCQKLGIEFFCEHIDIPALSLERKTSTELTAREERYKAFSKVCKQYSIDCVATAHTQSDCVETVLFNLVRGSGTGGLCGIPAKRPLEDGICVIRPLIYVTRSEVELFLKEHKQDYITDSSNLTDDYTRNYLRNNVIQRLKTINPSLEESVSRLSRTLQSDNELLTKLAYENFTNELDILSRFEYAILSRIIIKIFSDYSQETPGELHIRRLCDEIYLFGINKGKKINLSFTDGFIAKSENGRLIFSKDSRKKEKDVVAFEKPLDLGENFFEQSPFALFLSYDENKDIVETLYNKENIYKKYTTDYLYSDKILAGLYARNRKESDVIFSNGIHKKLKRIFNQNKLDKNLRDCLPLICDNEGNILLIPSVCVCDSIKIKQKQSRTLCVTLYKKENPFSRSDC